MPASALAPVSLDALLDALHEIRDELRALRSDGAQSRRRPDTLTRVDRQRLAQLLPAIVGAVGSEPFTVNEALGYAAVRLVVGPLTALQMGRLLRRGTGIVIDRLVVDRVGEELHRALWKVVATI